MGCVKSVLLIAVALCACSDTLGPGIIAGKWTEDFTVPGNSLEMDLSYSDGKVSGTGSWCGEAAPCGILSVTGTVGENVQLDLTFTQTLPPTTLPPSVQHFEGRFSSWRALHGTLGASPPGTLPFVREISFHRS